MERTDLINVAVCTDNIALAHGFVHMFEGRDELQATGLLGTGAEIIAQLLACAARDVLLLDWAAYLDVDLLSKLKSDLPHCRIILWVRSISPELASQAIALGIRGILRMGLPSETILKCVQKVADGEVWLESSLISVLFQAKRISLTRRERELILLLSQGLKNKEIAVEMKLSEGTVKIYLSRLFQKVGAKDRFELALLGLKSIGTDGFENRQPNLLLSSEASCHLRPIRQSAMPAIIFSQTS